LSFLDALRRGFSRTFWVANVLELFERFAYYGSKAVLAVFIAEQVGLGAETATVLAGSVFNTLIYFLPLFAGTVVDRYGFKRSLMACFGIFSVGYFLIGLGGLPIGQPLVQAVGPKAWMLIALVVTAIGGSLIKPSIVGTVARTTTDETKALGYSIYYTLVNIGGAVGPFIALAVRVNVGISYVLVVSSLTSLVLFACTALFYREPSRPADAPATGAFSTVLSRMLKLLFSPVILLWHAARVAVSSGAENEPRRQENLALMRSQYPPFKFLLFLVIFSGFWAMFWHVFYALPFYVKDFLKFARFEVIETVDAMTIIVVTIPATAIAKRLKPLSAMVLGFVIATASWFVMGSTPTVFGAVAAMMLFAVGESIQSPRFYEYVANLAPPDQVGTYMGFAFLPIAIGTFIAGWSSGYLVAHYVEGGNPAAPQMWYVVGAYGVVSTILMVLYDRFVAPRRTAA
jgi:dipeptide/tripeptide permease